MTTAEKVVEAPIDVRNIKRCNIFSRRVYLRLITVRFPDCRRGAKWFGRSPCCGSEWYACNRHRDNQLPYLCCGHEHPNQAMNWRPI